MANVRPPTVMFEPLEKKPVRLAALPGTVRIVNDSLSTIVPLVVKLSVAPERLTLLPEPVTLTRSETPPPTRSIDRNPALLVATGFRSRPPRMVRVAGVPGVPGATAPSEATEPLRVPLPPSEAPGATEVTDERSVALLTISVPAETVVPPV
jgi:hypothetical protein